MKRLRLIDTATKYTSTRNRYGDLINSGATTISCLFRDISMLNRGVNYREEITIKGIFWFDANSGVAKGDVIGFDGQLYRMEEVTNAKDLLKRNQVQFIKCLASQYRAFS